MKLFSKGSLGVDLETARYYWLVVLLLVSPAKQEFLVSRNMKKQPMLNAAVVG
jgi:hypothetical protein